MFSAVSQSGGAGVSHRAAASLICCLSFAARLIPHVLILRPRERDVQFPSPLSGQLASFRKACETADLAGAWISSLARRVSAMQKKN